MCILLLPPPPPTSIFFFLLKLRWKWLIDNNNNNNTISFHSLLLLLLCFQDADAEMTHAIVSSCVIRLVLIYYSFPPPPTAIQSNAIKLHHIQWASFTFNPGRGCRGGFSRMPSSVSVWHPIAQFFWPSNYFRFHCHFFSSSPSSLSSFTATLSTFGYSTRFQTLGRIHWNLIQQFPPPPLGFFLFFF